MHLGSELFRLETSPRNIHAGFEPILPENALESGVFLSVFLSVCAKLKGA
jgi:hypothetical protein